jgi:DNA segregation ATPase FtsK/SpoIIIE, S-DNA-T family
VSTTNTLVGTPDPDEPGKLLEFRKPTASPESMPVVIEAEIVDAESDVVRVDPPDTRDDRTLAVRMRSAMEARRQPVIVPWLRSRSEFTVTMRWVVGYAGHTVAFHAVRMPLYAAILAARSPRGLLRAIVGTGGWAFDREASPLRLAAVARNDADLYLKLARERAERVKGRLWLVAILAGLLTVAGLLVFTWGPWWARVSTVAGAVGLFGWLGTPSDKRIAGRAVVTSKPQKLTGDIVVRALSALGIAQINQAVAKGGGGDHLPRADRSRRSRVACRG